MTDDWKARAVPAVYPAKFGASLHVPSTVKGAQQTRRLELPELEVDPSDWERPARIIAPSVPEGVAWRLRGLQRLVEAAPVCDFTVSVKLPSAANLREHWATKAKREAAIRRAVTEAIPAKLRGHFTMPRPADFVVLLVRQAPRLLDRHDNLPRACKAAVDALAKAMCIDDRDKRVQWETEQEKCSTPSLRVVVVTR